MALGASSLRVAYANLYSNLGDKLDDVKVNKSKQIKEYESKSMYHFDYYVCDTAYDFLVGKGIPLSMHCYRPHPHPISKMIENHILINVFGSYLRAKNCFISLKENKISLVNHRSSAGKDITKNVSLFNRLVHAKDALRYTNAVRTPEITLSEKLKGQLNASDIVFIHDEVHYWSLSDFQKFLGVCDKDIVYSVIYPAEINDGQTISLNPLLYKFRKSECGTHFTWAPDGSYNGAYVQPINPWLLTTSRTVDTRFRTWTISKLESIGAHHVFLCTLGSKVTEDEYTYCDYTLLDPRKFSDSSLRMPELRAELVRKTAHYLMALKKPDAASAVSKLRQLTKGDESADEILFLGKLARTVSSTKYFEENGLYRFGKSLRQTLKRCFGRWSAYMLDKDDYDKLNLQTILKGLCSTEIRVSRKFRDLVITREMMRLQGLHEAMDMMFYGVDSVINSNECKVVPDREAQPYSHNLYAELYRFDDPMIKLKRFKEVIGQNVPRSYRSRVYYCEGVPLSLFRQLISPEGTNLYRTCLSIATVRDIDLLKDKLISKEEYERRSSSRDVQTPVKETGLEHLNLDVEADQGWDEAIGQVVNIGKNTCALGPIQRVMEVGVEYILSELNSLDINFSRYVSEKGITLVGLMECGRLLKLTYAVHTKHGAIHCSGERKPFAVELVGDHAKEVPYIPFENSAHNALRLSDGCGLAQIRIKSAYAQKVRDSFQKEFTGIMLSDLEKTLPNFSSFQDAWVKVYTFFGFAGSGKSSYLTKICGLLPDLKVEVVSPRRLLKDEWEKWLKKGKGKAHTFENYILRGMMQPDLLIVDEVSLFPPGYIDLIYFMKKPKHLALLGDPLQTSYYSKDDNLFLSQIEADVFQRICEIPSEDASIPYLIYTHRLPEKQGLFEVHSDGPGELKVLEVRKLDKKVTTLCFKRIKDGEYEGFKEVLTVGQGQGMSRDVIQLVMDNGCLYSDDRTLITALTRARKEIRVHYMVDKSTVMNGAKSHMMRSFCAGEKISLDRLLSALKSSLRVEPKLLRSELYIGNGEIDAESRLDGDPYLKAMLKLLHAEEMEEEEAQEESVPGHSKTHLPLSSFSNELFATELNAKEMREAFSDDFGYSNQITDVMENKRFGAPWSHAAIYLNHKSDDDLTFMMTIKKRLRFCDYERNKTNYLKKGGTGRQMFEILKRKLDLDNYVPHVEIEEKEREFMEKRIAKSQALLEKHSVRSDPDWPSNILKVFIKNQTCTKMEKRGIDAKAGQSIACFSHAVLCKFGPQLRKTENEFRSLLPGNIMIFSQKNFDDLDKWCKDYFNDFSGTDSDYEAFDRSQDATILGLEVSMLEHFKWPFELIEEYKELKLMMGCTLGDLAIMRFSGEFGTFFFNTVCNMAFTYMRYDIDKHYPVAFAGDDMVAPGRLRVLSCYDDLLNKLELKAKVNYGDSPLFCGWRVSPLGIVKDPNLLLDRWEIAVEKRNLDDCMCNYALEASYGYKLSDSLYELNIDIDSYQELIRKIIKVKKKLPKAISDIFSPDEDVYSSSEE